MPNPGCSELQAFKTEFLLPYFGKSVSSTTEKLPLCFLEDSTYDTWLAVFDAWEQGKIIGEDGLKPRGTIPKIPRQNITANDVCPTIGLRDSDSLRLAQEILACNVAIKTNKMNQFPEAITLKEWCREAKFNRIVKNELMLEFKGYKLPCKDADYVPYPDSAWSEFATARNITEAIIDNIRKEVCKYDVGLKWFEGRYNPLNPTNEKTGPAPLYYAEAVKKFATVDVAVLANTGSVLKYDVRVADSLEQVIDCLSPPCHFDVPDTTPELFFIFAYDTTGESCLITKKQIATISERMKQNVDVDDEDEDFDDDMPGHEVKVVVPHFWICDQDTRNLVATHSNLKQVPFSQHSLSYLPTGKGGFRNGPLDSRPLVTVSIIMNRVSDMREKWKEFSKFTGIKKPLDPVWDDKARGVGEDWASGDCTLSYDFLQHLLTPILQKRPVKLINLWGGGNVTALALVSHLELSESSLSTPVGGPPMPLLTVSFQS